MWPFVYISAVLMICTFSPRSKNSSAGIQCVPFDSILPFWLPLKEKENVFRHADMSLQLLRHECRRSCLYFTCFSFIEGVKKQQVCDIASLWHHKEPWWFSCISVNARNRVFQISWGKSGRSDKASILEFSVVVFLCRRNGQCAVG